MEARSIARRSKLASVVTDHAGRVVYWNRAALELFGRASSDAEGQTFPEVVGGRDVFGNRMVHEEGRFRDIVEGGDTISNFAFDVVAAERRRCRVVATVLLILGPGEAMHVVYQLRPVRARRKTDVVMRSLDRRLARGGRREIGSAAGRPTPRQLEVLGLIADGMSAAEISTALGISRNTARNHTQHLLERLGVHSKTEAVAVGIRHDLI